MADIEKLQTEIEGIGHFVQTFVKPYLELCLVYGIK